MKVPQSHSSHTLVDRIPTPQNGLSETSESRPGLLPSLARPSKAGQPNNVGHISAVEEGRGSIDKPLPNLPGVASAWYSNSWKVIGLTLFQRR